MTFNRGLYETRKKSPAGKVVFRAPSSIVDTVVEALLEFDRAGISS